MPQAISATESSAFARQNETLVTARRSTLLVLRNSVSRHHDFDGLFQNCPYTLIQLTDMASAITRLALGDIDLVIAESAEGSLHLELCSTIKSGLATRLLPFLIVSDSNEIGDEVRAIRAGADDWFAYPLRSASFLARVQASLSKKRITDSLDDTETILYSLARSVEGRDPCLGDHCQRLAAMSSAIGTLLGLPAQDLVALHRAGYLHDIGKITIPDSILLKPGPLTSDEWTLMKSHPERGEHICSGLKSMNAVLPIIRHHHEKWDGSGYPNGLRGEQIPLLARILQLVDIYDALTTQRSYKRALAPLEAIDVIRRETELGWHDPDLTNAFVDSLPKLSEADAFDSAQLSLYALAESLTTAGVTGSAPQLSE